MLLLLSLACLVPLAALGVGLYVLRESHQPVLPWLGIAALLLTILSVLILRVGSHILASYHWMHTAARALAHGAPIDAADAPLAEARQLGHAFEHAAAAIADANAAHAEKSARLKNILDTAMDAIITADDKGRIVMFNNAAEQMMRLARWEAIGLPLDIFVPHETRGNHMEMMRRFAEEPARPRRLAQGRVIKAVRGDGESFLAEASISAARDEDEIFYTVIMRDVTQRERQLQDLMRSNEDLKEEVERLTRVIDVLRKVKRIEG
jgi:PAS domain S-box-containing protein